MTQLKKQATIKRDPISGHHQHVDVPQGEYSVNELRNRSDARLEALKAAIDSDSSKGGKMRAESEHPALGDAYSRMLKPRDGKHDNRTAQDADEHYGSGKEESPARVDRFHREK